MSATVRNNETAHPKIWPFEEAAKVARRLASNGKDHALFETGYGPSGLPHIGTFGEVAQAIVYVSSDKASFITGATIPIDGGALAQ